jgi:hypothetical protein
MPDKHPNTKRWGGPGASHEDRSEPQPDPSTEQRDSERPTNAKASQVSTGGGERDVHHTHNPATKS